MRMLNGSLCEVVVLGSATTTTTTTIGTGAPYGPRGIPLNEQREHRDDDDGQLQGRASGRVSAAATLNHNEKQQGQSLGCKCRCTCGGLSSAAANLIHSGPPSTGGGDGQMIESGASSLVPTRQLKQQQGERKTTSHKYPRQEPPPSSAAAASALMEDCAAWRQVPPPPPPRTSASQLRAAQWHSRGHCSSSSMAPNTTTSVNGRSMMMNQLDCQSRNALLGHQQRELRGQQLVQNLTGPPASPRVGVPVASPFERQVSSSSFESATTKQQKLDSAKAIATETFTAHHRDRPNQLASWWGSRSAACASAGACVDFRCLAKLSDSMGNNFSARRAYSKDDADDMSNSCLDQVCALRVCIKTPKVAHKIFIERRPTTLYYVERQQPLEEFNIN